MAQTRIIRVNSANWPRWKDKVLRVMRRAFPRKLWWTEKNFSNMFREDRYIARLVIVGDEFAGFTFGMWDEEPEKELGNLPKECQVAHLYYLFLKPELRHQGIGYEMRNDFVRVAQSLGYKKLSSFVRSGPALRNAQKTGAKVIGERKNFYGTGDTYYLTALDL